jgi:hypothetical protein
MKEPPWLQFHSCATPTPLLFPTFRISAASRIRLNLPPNLSTYEPPNLRTSQPPNLPTSRSHGTSEPVFEYLREPNHYSTTRISVNLPTCLPTNLGHLGALLRERPPAAVRRAGRRGGAQQGLLHAHEGAPAGWLVKGYYSSRIVGGLKRAREGAPSGGTLKHY